MSNSGVQIRVRGKVQGVGFRPFVWQVAQRLHLKGDVCNDGAGVVVRLLGESAVFLAHLNRDCPPLARIDETDIQPMRWDVTPVDFTIRHSAGGSMSTQIVPDAATCPACLAEMNDPAERRYRYPFINCTHCGPRFTIIRAMPYDRPFTVMAKFPLCAACEAEYRNPYDRRFHAQPVACAACGPALMWRRGGEPEAHDGGAADQESALQAAVALLACGGIVAVKGLGGFHLACDARNGDAVARLRQRKRRPAKPLAVMISSADGLPPQARTLLSTPAAPVVLVEKSGVNGLCEAIAPGLDEVGVMLPATPLHHLLMQALDRPLVMTSGNLSGKPPALTNAQALADLADIADGFLLHNRDIVQRMDDSVIRQNGEMLRRSRGYVPDAIALPPGFHNVPPMLCLGADLKNTFCLVRGEQAVLSQHFGDLTDEGVEAQWQQSLSLMQTIYDFTPHAVVADAHPGYHSSQWAAAHPLPHQTVLHHHAHIAACLAEHRWPLDGGDVIALALDGIGMGEGGAWWGGECLRVNYRECERLGGLPAVALPGGDLAARQPWRNLLAQCLAFVPAWERYPETAGIRAQNWPLLAKAIERGINSPPASSCGRLFDAVAAALGGKADVVGGVTALSGGELRGADDVSNPLSEVVTALRYEGEAACMLEALAATCDEVQHPVSMPVAENQLDLTTFWREWLNWQATPAERAWAFHDALAAGFASLMRAQAQRWGITTLVFSGGVLHNRLLRKRLGFYLSDFDLLFPQQFPAGDGAIALGQAVVAAARISKPGSPSP